MLRFNGDLEALREGMRIESENKDIPEANINNTIADLEACIVENIVILVIRFQKKL